MTVSAPEEATGEYTIYVSVMDKEGNTYPDVEILVRVSNPIVSIVTQQLLAGGENAVSERVNSWVVTVKNEGLVDAIGVQLNATLCSDLACNNEVLSDIEIGDVRQILWSTLIFLWIWAVLILVIITLTLR